MTSDLIDPIKVDFIDNTSRLDRAACSYFFSIIALLRFYQACAVDRILRSMSALLLCLYPSWRFGYPRLVKINHQGCVEHRQVAQLIDLIIAQRSDRHTFTASPTATLDPLLKVNAGSWGVRT